ncbi:MAG: hydroxymethylbilane synthase [Hydrogenophilus sp.]|nr:hydroxymethylbilane synthase [Hydrogenophilus sp.]
MLHEISPRRLVIATRESRLARWQAEFVASRVRELYPDCEVVLLGVTTRGDQILDRPLAKVGGKGLFVKELEVALLEGRADIAVHSLKDVPMEIEKPFFLAAILSRGCVEDAFVSNRFSSLEDLPPGARVGTSSLRRQAQLIAYHPYICVKPLRGNLDTRLAKLDRGEYDALVLAAAGLERLGLRGRIRARLPVQKMIPAPGQGALAVEALAARDDLASWLKPLTDPDTERCVAAERAFARRLGGSCEVPIAAYARMEEGGLKLVGLVAEPDGTKLWQGRREGKPDEAESIGRELAEQLLKEGAEELLARLGAGAEILDGKTCGLGDTPRFSE